MEDPGSSEGGFMQSLRSEPFRRRVFDNNALIEVRVTEEAEGDCMYASIVAAISPEDDTEGASFQALSELQLRDVVARGVTDEVLQQYSCDHGRGMAHTEFMDSVHNLEDLRQQIRLPRQVWGDSYALAELACHLDIVFLLWSEPLVPLRKFNSGYPFVAIPAPPVCRDKKELRYTMLQHTRREHYNLITWNQQAVFRFSDLPPVVLQRWSHIWDDDANGERKRSTRKASAPSPGIKKNGRNGHTDSKPKPGHVKGSMPANDLKSKRNSSRKGQISGGS